MTRIDYAKLNPVKYAETAAHRNNMYADAILDVLQSRPNEDVSREELESHCSHFSTILAIVRRRGYRVDNVGSGGYNGKDPRYSAYKLVTE
jgi:hypothetical protein